MDVSERARYKQLAIDTIVASPVHSEAAKLAEALEQCVDELERLARCPACGDDENPDWPGAIATLEHLGFRLEPL